MSTIQAESLPSEIPASPEPVKTPGGIGYLILFLLGMAIIIAAHFIFLLGRFAPAISDPDANGYWAQGSLLFTTGKTWFTPEADAQYIGMHWLVTDSGRYYSRYPAGLAVITGLVYTIAGYKAAVLVNPVFASLTLLGMGLFIRRLLGAWWALAATIVLAINPLFNQHAIQCFAHMAVMAFLAWSLFFLIRWSQDGKLYNAFLFGLLLGCIPTIRYPEALYGVAAGVFVLLHLLSRPKIWLHCIVAIAGAAIPLVPLMIHNQIAFGAFYKTAYSLTNEQTGFGWEYFKQHWINYIRGLNGEGVGPFFLIGTAGMICMLCFRKYWKTGLLFILISVPSLLVYMAYYWGGRGGMADGMRFILPTLICYIAAGAWLLSQVTRNSPVAAAICGIAVILLLQFAWGGLSMVDEAARGKYEREVLVAATDSLENKDNKIEHGSVIISNNQLLQHLDFVRHWKLAELNQMGMMGTMRMPGRSADATDSDEPSPMQMEKFRLRLEKYKDLTYDQKEKMLATDLHHWADGKKVYYVGPESGLDMLGRQMLSRRNFKIIAKIPLPEPPKLSSLGPGRGQMGRTTPASAPAGIQGPAAGMPGGIQGPPGGMQGPAGGIPGGQFPPMMPGAMGRFGVMSPPKEYIIAEWTYEKAEAPPTRPADGRRIIPGPQRPF